MTRRALVLLVLAGALLAGHGTAWAAWRATGTGQAAGRAAALGVAPAPAASVTGGNDVALTVTQTAFRGQLLGAVPGGGWRITRYDANGVAQAQTAGSTCTGLLSGAAATIACSEPNVPEGSWRYAAVPSLQAWRGTESTRTSVVSNTGPPTLSTLHAFDVNANGRIDQVVATFSEQLATPYTAGNTPWTLTNVPSGGSLASVAVSGAAATLTLNEGTGSATTSVGNFRVALAANAAGIRDAAGATASFASTAPADKAAPARTAMDMRDNDTDGRVDRVVMTFSESLASYSAGNTPWTLTGVPSGGSLSSVSVSSPTVTLNLSEGSGAQSTAVGSFTIALAASASGVRDSAGNQTAWSATAPTDDASPVAVAVAANDGGGTVSRMQTGDTLVLTYSETVAPSTILPGWAGTASSVTVRVDNGSGTFGDDSLTIRSGSTTLDLGTVNLNRWDYVSGGDVDFTGSTIVGGGATITITLGTPDQPSRVVTAGGSEDMRWTPSSGAADAAGNPVVNGVSVTESGTEDRDF